MCALYYYNNESRSEAEQPIYKRQHKRPQCLCTDVATTEVSAVLDVVYMS